MVYVSVKVGPKGQVVIPKVFRDDQGIEPGQQVVFEQKIEHGEKELVMKKKANDFIAFLGEFRKKHAIKNFKYDSDKAYDEMMEERFAPLLKKLGKRR